MIYATGDLHGNALRFQSEYFPGQAEMTKDDLAGSLVYVPHDWEPWGCIDLPHLHSP